MVSIKLCRLQKRSVQRLQHACGSQGIGAQIFGDRKSTQPVILGHNARLFSRGLGFRAVFERLAFLYPPLTTVTYLELTREIDLPKELAVDVGFAWLKSIFATPLYPFPWRQHSAMVRKLLQIFKFLSSRYVPYRESGALLKRCTG